MKNLSPIIAMMTLCLSTLSNAHDDIHYDFTIKSVNSTKANLVIKGTLSLIDRKYGGANAGPLLPQFRIFGVEGTPNLGSCMNRDPNVEAYRSNNKIHQDFTFDLQKWIGYALPQKGIKIISFIKDIPDGKQMIYKDHALRQIE